MGRRVHSGSLVSLARAPVVIGLIRALSINLGAPRWSWGSFGIAWFIRTRCWCHSGKDCLNRARPRRHWVHSGSFGSFARVKEVVGLIEGRPCGHRVHSRPFG